MTAARFRPDRGLTLRIAETWVLLLIITAGYGALIGFALQWLVGLPWWTCLVLPVVATVALIFLLLLGWRTVVSLFVDSAVARRSIVVLGAGERAAIFNEAFVNWRYGSAAAMSVVFGGALVLLSVVQLAITGWRSRS
jgi:hypothetical protein